MIRSDFIKKADAARPRLAERSVRPQSEFTLLPHRGDYIASDVRPAAAVTPPLGRGAVLLYDFGTHCVGYLSLTLTPCLAGADAPAYLRLTFGERLCELGDDPASYSGSLSRGWLQIEHIHVDELPARLTLPRRYAFRYLKIEVLDTSGSYRLSVSDIELRAVSALSDKTPTPRLSCHTDPLSAQLDEVGIRTLENCAQDVFEDGPKRDRRLWLGDLRLQAQAAYITYGDYALARRCLYLFAAMPMESGEVSACVYTRPTPHADGLRLFDYSLFFVCSLYDYYRASGDGDTLRDLWGTACRQIELAAEALDGRGVVRDQSTWWCFVDWNKSLNKQASAQAILTLALENAIFLARELGDSDAGEKLEVWYSRVLAGSRRWLWDSKAGFFCSGDAGQISYASQVWHVLARTLDDEASRALLLRCQEEQPSVTMNTPYMMHHYVEALFSVGLHDLAWQEIERYWGGMLRAGADCYFEAFDPADPDFSPYGSRVINSYCHAWSCTPVYFLRKYGR